MASFVCLRLSLAVCALHAVAAIAKGDAPANGTKAGATTTGTVSSLVDQVFSQAVGQVPVWNADLPQQFAPLLGESFLGDSDSASPATLIYLRVSSDYLSKRFEKAVNRTKPVVDNILGTRIRGKSLTRGHTRMVLIPDGDRFVAEIEFTGTVDSRTRGTNGPAILHYKSASTFRATKRLTLDGTGLSVKPAHATAETKLQPLRIESQSGGFMGMIVERVARRRVAESRQQANAIASDHTADIIRGDLDRGFEKSIGVLTTALAEAAGLKPAELAQLTTSGAGQRLHLMLRTTRDHAELVLAPQAVTWSELAGVIPVVDGSPHVALRVHRSALTSSGPTSTGSPALARLLAHGMKKHLAKRTAALVELPIAKTNDAQTNDAQTNDHPVDWSINLNWLCVDVCREAPPEAGVFRSAQMELEPPRPSMDGGQ